MPVCSCTELGHAELKEMLNNSVGPRKVHVDRHDYQPVISLKRDLPLILQKLGWGSELGCTVCRPVIHYYLQVSTRTIHDQEIESAQEIQVRWDNQIPLSSYARDAGGLATQLRTYWIGAVMPSPVSIGVAPGPGHW